MRTHCRRGTLTSTEYRGHARVAHAVVFDDIAASSLVAESIDWPRGLKRTWLDTLKEVQFYEQR